MTPHEISPAIARLQMLTAAAETDEDIAEVQDVLASFNDVRAQRELVRRLAVDVAAKMPDGGALAVRDAADFIALGLLQATQALDRADLRELVSALEERALSDLAAALVVFWHEACLQAAAVTLTRVSVPEHAPEEL